MQPSDVLKGQLIELKDRYVRKMPDRIQAIASTPEATSKYFIVSIVLLIPAALLFLSIAQGANGDDRTRRLAKWAAIASILAFLLITFPANR